MVRNTFDNNKENLESALENLLIPLANQYLNELTLQDLLGLIGGSDESSGGAHLDPETGDLVCHVDNEESPTTEYVPSAETSTQSVDDPTRPDELTTFSDEPTTKNGIESTTPFTVPDDDVPNSSNFLFHKFQVMIYTITSIISLMSL